MGAEFAEGDLARSVVWIDDRKFFNEFGDRVVETKAAFVPQLHRHQVREHLRDRSDADAIKLLKYLINDILPCRKPLGIVVVKNYIS